MSFFKLVSIYKYKRVTNTRQKLLYINTYYNETVEGYKVAYEKKRQILYSRMDDSMIKRLREIRRKTGISVSEIIRESVRRMLLEVDTTGSINLKIN